ncbi:MAG TPA: hypothetical protein VMW69_09865, partial [Spirochaetia bacterium]|nr:hypothetical protein [Spirochaetia bacterium]
ASFMKDVILTLTSLCLFLLFFVAAGLTANLAIDRGFLLSIPVIFVASISIYAYGVLVSVLTDNANSALALFLGGFLLLLLILFGSEAIVGGYARSLSTVAAWVIQWFSPFFYWSLAMKAQTNGETGLLLLALFGQLALAAVVLIGSHFFFRFRGVRA